MKVVGKLMFQMRIFYTCSQCTYALAEWLKYFKYALIMLDFKI